MGRKQDENEEVKKQNKTKPQNNKKGTGISSRKVLDFVVNKNQTEGKKRYRIGI